MQIHLLIRFIFPDTYEELRGETVRDHPTAIKIHSLKSAFFIGGKSDAEAWGWYGTVSTINM